MTVPLNLKVFQRGTLIATHRFDRDLIRIGRVIDADLRLIDGKLGRVHCVIKTASDGSLSLEDWGSTNGTFVNGQRIKTTPISFGEEIVLGDFTLIPEDPTTPHGT